MPVVGFGGEMALRTAVTLGNKQFLRSIDQMERKMGGFTSFMHRSSRKFAAGAGIITAGLGLSVKAAADFEQAMANMDSVARTTGAEFERLRDLAYDMSTTTTRGATEAANAMYELASSGQRAAQIYSTLPAVIKLADATQFDLSQTTTTVVGTLNAFGLEVDQTERLVNVLAASIGGSMAKMDKLSNSFSYIGPIASKAGLSIEETSAALMVLYNASLDGSAAGTALRRILAALLKPTESLKKRISDLNLPLTAIDPRMHSMSEIMQTLSDAGLDATAAFEDFGLRGAPALLALLEAGDGLDKFETMITGTNTAAEMLAVQMDTVAGQGKILKNTLVTLGIKVGEKLLPTVRKLIDFLTRLMDKFDGMSDTAFALTAKLGLLAGGMMGVLSIVGRAAPLLGAAAGPIGILAIAVGALAAAYIVADQTMSDYYDALREGNIEEARALENKVKWASMMKALFSSEYWAAIGSDIFIFFQRIGASMSAFFAALSNDAKLIGEAFNPKNWIDPDWRRQFTESFQLGDVGQMMQDAWEKAPVDLPEGATSWTQHFYDELFTPPADVPAKIAASVGAAVEEALGEGIPMPTGGLPELSYQIADFYAKALEKGWDPEETQAKFLETFGAIEAMATTSSDLVGDRFRAMSQRVQDEMAFAADALGSFMNSVGEDIAEALLEEKKFAKALVKAVGSAYADIVEMAAKKAVTNTLMAQAETVGILSMEGLFNPAAWLKLAPALLKGAATIALIKTIRGKLGFHTGGAPFAEGFKWVKADEMILDRPTVQRGGYGRATLDAAGGDISGGARVTVTVQIGQATMKDIDTDARRIGQIIGDEIEQALNVGA